MLISRSGKVIKPSCYKAWYAEITGNSADTGGFYIFIFDPDNKTKFCYWDVSEALVYEQLKLDKFEIKWQY